MAPFRAVVTTGIYCRPGCPARPNPDNVREYALAAAAEAAGYRACLRCRPYRLEAAPGRVGPELVCRAVAMITEGALDQTTEDGLGARLGVSARHLRRLFRTHVGVTPDQLARSRRVHFARRLLDDTDLSVTEVAFAAGFGSVRQLNRACAQVFQAAPVALRARRRRSDRLVADGGLTLRLGFTPPLAWGPMLTYLHRRAIAGVEVVADGVYRRTVVIDGDPGVIEIGPGDGQVLVLRAHLPHWEGLIHVVAQARKIFALDAEGSADGALGADAVLGPLVAAHPGLRLPGTWDPFELAVRAIIGQQASVVAASTIAARLTARHGRALGGLGQLGLSHLFPSASELAGADLSGLGLMTGRAAAIGHLARAVADGRLRLERGRGPEQLVGVLEALPGVGPWTASYVAARLGEPDAFPHGDLGLQRAYRRLAGPGEAAAPGTPAAALALARASDRWRPWRATAAAHLWLSESAVAPGGAVDGPDARA